MGLGGTSGLSTKWPLFQDSGEIGSLNPSASLLVMEQQILEKIQHPTMRGSGAGGCLLNPGTFWLRFYDHRADCPSRSDGIGLLGYQQDTL